ncbi:hypothetical protein EW146_g90 [Bondarzewia mesenterica]|uniref:Golgi apparatus membrane protein TVP23 n=1 Tax=Bondarzewia mesenterica TaxID=1095465 RepID=A0A4S4M8M9_9AGAM|nr:hypothetical protein EW146_g90 [Bondarzewia mesenterica]
MSASAPLLQTIESDEEPNELSRNSNSPANAREPVSRAQGAMASTQNDAESGIAGIFKQSAHPLSLLSLYFFRIAAITTYILCGFFTDKFVISTVVVVILLAMDFWNCRNVSGRTLVGLRFWNQVCYGNHSSGGNGLSSLQVDDDGESYWVFESRDVSFSTFKTGVHDTHGILPMKPSRPANPIDSKMFWIALYVFPALWLVLFIVSLLKFNLSFVPIVILALVFNMTNAIGFTYADRDAKQKWAKNAASSGWNMGMGGIGGSILTGVVKNSVGKVFGA